MPDLSLTVFDRDHRRKTPLAGHTSLSLTDLGELEAIYLALGYAPSQLHAEYASGSITASGAPALQVVA